MKDELPNSVGSILLSKDIDILLFQGGDVATTLATTTTKKETTTGAV